MESFPVLALTLLFSATLPSTGESGKVLVYSADGSHWLNMKIMVEALHSQGHEITVLRSSTSWYISEFSPYYTSITVIQHQAHHIESQDMMSSFLKRSIEIRQNAGSLWRFFEFHRHIFGLITESQKAAANLATAVFENKTLLKELEDTGYDVCLTDPVFPAGVLLSHYLHLPLVFNVRWLYNGEAHMAFAPSPLSYIPELFSELSDKMDFFQRLRNVISHGMIIYMHHFYANPPYQALCDRYFEPGVTPMSLILEADIWLMRVDFTFEFPRPTMPNVVYIGGFQAKTPKPLSQDLEAFVQSSGEHGVIIMTLGTLLSDLGPEITEIFASAFASLPQKVVWRYIGQRPASLGNNTMLVEWLPQNDLLGHPKTKAFVTHGGTNGLYQAIYHGVPIVGIPLIFDQHDNIVRMKSRGVAEMLEIAELDVESVMTALKNILDPQKQYQQKMLKLSQVHRDKPMKPVDTAVFWIEYVMRHRGAPHLRGVSHKLPWYVYHSLDVLAFFVGCGLLLIATVLFFWRCIIRFLIKSRKPKCD
ncbi:UDP-glucuronosyltransferase 2B23-like [Salarias fasciatus]|uniref:UDP-glucuronosyltransferase n=1 Tax=Salarias fasciatus TaxID=181472 RepID=A0A672ITM1_SALFA|nr:UDP-glucuronosyltransferase 2B23-like [Salarias fasciatus]XP_029974504.1 UDP-glucuronosyltransferase 2B23-like [Salarias fasciatus]XP_029974505.1 UDP-glucuronosyltransferase 2B23-like [Salarias fasciatus]XP_029975574.1 UDP-glucuronosyltransferase 2B23-like [Salarias fasciatus]XP_029975575.1 UDP-glucuronosyltransferase 2B23-like [Salarias fasciatus]XP_029975576.1 UDP-glucuronosyltransferase 2B23-like [Salarias fasciatus]